jgi:hypothetical protein
MYRLLPLAKRKETSVLGNSVNLKNFQNDTSGTPQGGLWGESAKMGDTRITLLHCVPVCDSIIECFTTSNCRFRVIFSPSRLI